jgi:hypothetical protein
MLMKTPYNYGMYATTPALRSGASTYLFSQFRDDNDNLAKQN